MVGSVRCRQEDAFSESGESEDIDKVHDEDAYE